LVTAEALKPVSMLSKTLAGLLAGMAGHGLSPLALSGEKRHTIYGSRAWVTPRFGLALLPVDAGSGPLNCYGTGLGNQAGGCTVISTV